MAQVSVTRLRVRAARYLPQFLAYAFRAKAQAARAPGFLGGSLLADDGRDYWTLTVWKDRAAALDYASGGAHRKAMPKLALWCDEAHVATWDQPGDGVPGWTEAAGRLLAAPRPSKVLHPTLAHLSGAVRGPRRTRGLAIHPQKGP